VLKRWVALPRGIRWTIGGSAAVVLGLAITWVLFVPTADWLAHHDVGQVTGSVHETAVDNARGRLLTLGAGLFAAGALVFTARNFTLSREGQVTDRYTKAIEQLGSDKLDVRIGGIYALERVARDSARDHPTVMEVLTAFIREHSREQWPPSDDSADQVRTRSTRPDVQAALTVVGRRDPHCDIRQIDLTDAHLNRADLTRAHLSGADLTRADLKDARLGSADLTRADLVVAVLTGARLEDAVLTGAKLGGAILIVTDLTRAVLDGAILVDADLTRADLTGANLTGANLDGADLTVAVWPGAAPVPEGWTLDSGSGRLERRPRSG
jgi:hypothetical protein